ncbi:MAG: aminoglycoside phosphotransferase family protein [Ktedonobacterales bacterium]
MSASKMHDDEVHTDASLVRRLLTAQFPQWAELPIAPVPSAGTDNALYRLGENMVVRLPRIDWAVADVEKEQRWLPRLAPHLPLAIPMPLALGAPGEGYPWRWSIYRWLTGENATVARIADQDRAARDLAQFTTALRQIATKDWPLPEPPVASRGVPLATRDAETRAATASLEGALDTDAVSAAWEAALKAPAWNGPPVWIHGDLSPLNLLVEQGRISAVIDFGALGVGEPACDLMPAWNFFSAQTRRVFRAALAVDDATWARGRGWALSIGLIALPYYQHTNPVLANIARRAIAEVLADEA